MNMLLDISEIRKRKTPGFSAKLMNKTVTEGTGVRLLCKVNGYPKPTVAWLQDGVDLTTATFCTMSSEHSSYFLDIKSALPEHCGTYMCRLTNILGTVECEANLTVDLLEVVPEVIAPVFTKSISDLESSRNGTATFICTATGEPAPKITWYHDSIQLMVK